MGFRQGEDARHPEVVGDRHEIEVQQVALEDFAEPEQAPQVTGLLADGDAEGLLGSGQRGEGVGVGADPADPGDDRRHVPVVAPLEQPLEKARRFDDLEAAFLDLAAGGLDHQVGVPLDAGQVGDFNLHGAPPCR